MLRNEQEPLAKVLAKAPELAKHGANQHVERGHNGIMASPDRQGTSGSPPASAATRRRLQTAGTSSEARRRLVRRAMGNPTLTVHPAWYGYLLWRVSRARSGR